MNHLTYLCYIITIYCINLSHNVIPQMYKLSNFNFFEKHIVYILIICNHIKFSKFHWNSFTLSQLLIIPPKGILYNSHRRQTHSTVEVCFLCGGTSQLITAAVYNILNLLLEVSLLIMFTYVKEYLQCLQIPRCKKVMITTSVNGIWRKIRHINSVLIIMKWQQKHIINKQKLQGSDSKKICLLDNV